MKSLHVVALTVVFTLGSALAVLVPHDHASAADDTIVIRAQVDAGNNVVTIQRHYTYPGRWVTVGVFSREVPPDGNVFSHGSMALAVEFVPEFRRPLPPVAGFQTRFSGYLTPPRPPCEMVTYDDRDGNTITRELCRPGIRVAEVTCDWGFRVVLGPYDGVRQEVLDGVWVMGNVCPHGRLLRDGGLASPAGVITFDEFTAMITAALARVGETRPIDAIPVIGTEGNPIHSETTYVDIRVTWPYGVEGPPTITVNPRGGGAEQVLELGDSTTIGVYSIVPRP